MFGIYPMSLDLRCRKRYMDSLVFLNGNWR